MAVRMPSGVSEWNARKKCCSKDCIYTCASKVMSVRIASEYISKINAPYDIVTHIKIRLKGMPLQTIVSSQVCVCNECN